VPADETVPARHTRHDLVVKNRARMAHRIAGGQMQGSTRDRYVQAYDSFGEFLESVGIEDLADVTLAMVEDFKV
jgi:hypothetical protein